MQVAVQIGHTPPWGLCPGLPYTVKSIITKSYGIIANTDMTVRFGACLHRNRVALQSLVERLTRHESRGERRVYGGGRQEIEPSDLGRVGAAARVQRWPELAESVPREKMLSLFG